MTVIRTQPAPTPTRYDWLHDDLESAQLLSHTGLKTGEEPTIRPLHYNKPQLRAQSIGANETVLIWGRGTGKTEGGIALHVYRCVTVMPRSHGVIVGASYAKILENTLPGTIKGLEALGWRRDVDFWIRKQPPKSAGVPLPIVGPLTPEHCIFFRNGTVISLVSQDRPGAANGKTVHWIVGDEAKLLNKYALDNELLMTNRGDERFFGGIPEFHSTFFASDMPTDQRAMWLLDTEKRVDPKRIDVLLAIRLRIHQLEEELRAGPTPNGRLILHKALKGALQQWDSIRGNTTYLSEASTLENVEGFGWKNLQRLHQNIPEFAWRTAILNQRPYLSEFAFYPDLKDRHFYDAFDYDYIDSLGLTPEVILPGLTDCRKDADCDRDAPLIVGLDYGASINVMPTGQLNGRTLRVINAPYVRKPQRLGDLLTAWTTYYAPMREKTVYYVYDHTALGTDAVRDLSYFDTVMAALEGAGWDVIPVYLGVTSSYQYRYELSGRVLKGYDPELFDVVMNRNNCEYLKLSLQQTSLKPRSRRGKGDDFEKDKEAERDKERDQRETTHFSDAFDTVLCGVKSLVESGGIFRGNAGGSGGLVIA